MGGTVCLGSTGLSDSVESLLFDECGCMLLWKWHDLFSFLYSILFRHL